MPEQKKPAKRTSAAARQAAEYEPPILTEPKGGPVPAHHPAETSRARQGHNELKDYWLHGAGAARWTRWTDLYNHLKKHMANERAKRVAAEWFHERYGYWPGADKNRVAHGKPPRGDRVGPG